MSGQKRDCITGRECLWRCYYRYVVLMGQATPLYHLLPVATFVTD